MHVPSHRVIWVNRLLQGARGPTGTPKLETCPYNHLVKLGLVVNQNLSLNNDISVMYMTDAITQQVATKTITCMYST